ncbi:MAG: alpha/beta fold hydrolase [Hyphomicrobiaceae bacterium]
MIKDHSYRVPGGRVGVLLLHGLCGTPTEMRFVANGLARTGCTVHCPQLAGHCGTEADIKATRWQDWYASAERALDDLRKDCDVVIVGGLSTGAVLSLLLAARRPNDVQGTILLAPTLWLNGWLIPWYARLFNLVFCRSIARFVWFPDIPPHGIKDQRIREFIRSALFGGDSSIAGLPSTPGVAVLEHRWLVGATKRVLGTITQPTLILHAREDDYADLNNATFLQRKLRGLVDTVVLNDSYHIVTVDRQRHVVVDRATQFVERVAKQFLRPAARLVSMADAPRRGRA